MTRTPHNGPTSSATDWQTWYEVVRSWGEDLGRGEWVVDYPKPELIKAIDLEWENQDADAQRLRD